VLSFSESAVFFYMITFEVITIFPSLFDSFLKESFIRKAQEKKLIKINIHDLRKWASDKRKTVDDRPFGGGSGMVLKVEPVYRALRKIKKGKVVLFSPRGKKYNQETAFKLSKDKRIIFVCGRYEGVDERVARHLADLELSIGEYDLMGGELPAMVVMESVARLIPGVLGKKGFLKERIKGKGFFEYPQYTRPEVFKAGSKKWAVPKVLVSGHQKKIETWRKERGRIIEK